MVGMSDRERELSKHVARRYSLDREERSMRRLGLLGGLAVVLALVIFVVAVANQDGVDETYAIVWSASPDIYIGQLDLSPVAWSFIDDARFTLHLTIPDWGVDEARDLVYHNTTVDEERADFLRLGPLTGQVTRSPSGTRVPFEVTLEIESVNAELVSLKLLGGSNVIRGTVSSHPGKPLVELTSGGGGVSVTGGRVVEVSNTQPIAGVEWWRLTFQSSRVS
jgi:hypothetical protein